MPRQFLFSTLSFSAFVLFIKSRSIASMPSGGSFGSYVGERSKAGNSLKNFNISQALLVTTRVHKTRRDPLGFQCCHYSALLRTRSCHERTALTYVGRRAIQGLSLRPPQCWRVGVESAACEVILRSGHLRRMQHSELWSHCCRLRFRLIVLPSFTRADMDSQHI